jgi:hypothetical protein
MDQKAEKGRSLPGHASLVLFEQVDVFLLLLSVHRLFSFDMESHQ